MMKGHMRPFVFTPKWPYRGVPVIKAIKSVGIQFRYVYKHFDIARIPLSLIHI